MWNREKDPFSKEEFERLSQLKADINEGERNEHLTPKELDRAKFQRWRLRVKRGRDRKDPNLDTTEPVIEKVVQILDDPNDEKVPISEMSGDYIYRRGVEIIRRGSGFGEKERLILVEFIKNIRDEFYQQLVSNPQTYVTELENGDKLFSKGNKKPPYSIGDDPFSTASFYAEAVQQKSGEPGRVKISLMHYFGQTHEANSYELLPDGTVVSNTKDRTQKLPNSNRFNLSHLSFFTKLFGKSNIMNSMKHLLNDVEQGMMLEVIQPVKKE